MGKLLGALMCWSLVAVGCSGRSAVHEEEPGGSTGMTEPSAAGVAGASSGGITLPAADPLPEPSTTGTGGAASAPVPAGAAGVGGSDPALDLSLGSGDLTVLLVFDKSGSMADTWDGRGKWQIASDALLAGMDGVLDELTIGAILFPQPFECQVAPLSDASQIQFTSGRAFVEYWNSTVAVARPTGSTPLGLAFAQADSAIEQARSIGLLEERRFRVLVVTDGEPNCGTNPEELVQYASRWQEVGVETHVLGLPGSQAATDLLNRIASFGGTANLIAPGTPDELEDTFYAAVR